MVCTRVMFTYLGITFSFALTFLLRLRILHSRVLINESTCQQLSAPVESWKESQVSERSAESLSQKPTRLTESVAGSFFSLTSPRSQPNTKDGLRKRSPRRTGRSHSVLQTFRPMP